MARVICDNTDIKEVQPLAFRMDDGLNKKISCDDVNMLGVGIRDAFVNKDFFIPQLFFCRLTSPCGESNNFNTVIEILSNLSFCKRIVEVDHKT